MGADSGIEWTDDTVNFWWGCDEVSPACDLCYARRIDAAQAKRFGKDTHWNEHPRRLRVENAAKELARNNRRAIKEGKRRRQFINSMSDFFEVKQELERPRIEAMEAIRLADHCDCLLLTKRPEQVVPYLKWNAAVADQWGMSGLAQWLHNWLRGQPPANVQIGTTAENQTWLDTRFPHLMAIPARVRFLSCEPLLGPLNIVKAFNAWTDTWEPGTAVQTWPGIRDFLHHVIVGGESDDKRNNRARPMHPDWARGLRDQCGREGVLFHFKQWGDWADVTSCKVRMPSHEIRLTVDGCITSVDANPEEGEAIMRRVGKQKAGRLLDGRTWDELPGVGRA